MQCSLTGSLCAFRWFLLMVRGTKPLHTLSHFSFLHSCAWVYGTCNWSRKRGSRTGPKSNFVISSHTPLNTWLFLYLFCLGEGSLRKCSLYCETVHVYSRSDNFERLHKLTQPLRQRILFIGKPGNTADSLFMIFPASNWNAIKNPLLKV